MRLLIKFTEIQFKAEIIELLGEEGCPHSSKPLVKIMKDEL